MNAQQSAAYAAMTLTAKAEFLVRIGEAPNFSAALGKIGRRRRRRSVKQSFAPRVMWLPYADN